MSEEDTTVTTEESTETAPELSRFKNALNKIAPYTTHIATAVVVVVGGVFITKALNEVREEEDVFVDEEVIVVTTED